MNTRKTPIKRFLLVAAVAIGCALASVSAAAPAAPPPAPPTPAAAPATQPTLLDEIWSRTALSTLWYLSYAAGEQKDELFNRFGVGRGYITLKLKPVPWFQPRATIDLHQNDAGDWAARFKYLYAKFILPVETAVLTEPNVEIGIAHTPWFDFEEHVNVYRMEGTMFTERNGVMNSADVGITVGGLLGRKLPAAYRASVSSDYPGQWGSFALGVYNGGGYHAVEANDNKVFQGRLTLRPLGLLLPNLQASYFVVYGKGNALPAPDWVLHDVMLSFEHRYFVLTGHFATGKGNQRGDRVTATGRSLDLIGASGFAELKLPWISSSLIGRFDYFDWDRDGGDPATARLIAGYAFHFLPGNFALLSLDRVDYAGAAQRADWQIKATLQVHLPPKG